MTFCEVKFIIVPCSCVVICCRLKLLDVLNMCVHDNLILMNSDFLMSKINDFSYSTSCQMFIIPCMLFYHSRMKMLFRLAAAKHEYKKDGQ